jgi:energy-coupling factor transporter ATP-binding protein EcfA2
LTFQYRRGNSPALKDINFCVAPGEFVGITGPAGAGKTTLLSCIDGIIPHYYSGDLKGTVEVAGLNVASSSFHDLASIVGTVFEDPDFQMVSISVEEEVAFGPENLGVPREEILKRLDTALKKTRIEHLSERAINTLSGGQKQRVAISAVLSMLPQVILLDDPTSELDPVGTAEVFTALRELNRDFGIAIVVVSQDLERLVENSDRIIVLNEGKIYTHGTPREVCNQREVLVSAGVRVPDVVDFTLSLQEVLGNSLPIEKIPLTVEEAVPLLRKIFNENNIGAK